MKILPLISLSFVLALFCGCSILEREPYKETYYYDISYPEKPAVLKGLNVAVLNPAGGAPYSERMVFRMSPNRISIDEFNRWASSPSEMIKKYFYVVFSAEEAPGDRRLFLRLEILRFEALFQEKIAMVSLRATLSDDADTDLLCKIYTAEIPMEKLSGDDFAKASGIALDEISKKIADDIVSACKDKPLSEKKP